VTGAGGQWLISTGCPGDKPHVNRGPQAMVLGSLAALPGGELPEEGRQRWVRLALRGLII